MIKIILIVLVLAIAGILVAAWFQPDTMHIERSISIKAPAEKVFPYVNDFHKWKEWSAYETKDPAMKREYGGTEGKGATYAWSGDKNVGAGRMEIASSQPSSRIDIKLDFSQPFEAHNMANFIFTPAQDGGTVVTWVMTGPANLLSKVMCLFMDMDKMVGKDFEAGLANLKAKAEAP